MPDEPATGCAVNTEIGALRLLRIVSQSVNGCSIRGSYRLGTVCPAAATFTQAGAVILAGAGGTIGGDAPGDGLATGATDGGRCERRRGSAE